MTLFFLFFWVCWWNLVSNPGTPTLNSAGAIPSNSLLILALTLHWIKSLVVEDLQSLSLSRRIESMRCTPLFITFFLHFHIFLNLICVYSHIFLKFKRFYSLYKNFTVCLSRHLHVLFISRNEIVDRGFIPGNSSFLPQQPRMHNVDV